MNKSCYQCAHMTWGGTVEDIALCESPRNRVLWMRPYRVACDQSRSEGGRCGQAAKFFEERK